MGIRLRILLIVFTLIFIIMIIDMIKKEQLDLKYILVWIFASIVVIFMSIYPTSIVYLSELLDIATPTNALFFVGLCLLIIIIITLTIAQSRNSQKIRNLVQKVALLEYELKTNKEKKEIGI